MDLLQSNTGVLPPALRALALGLLVETVVPLIHNPQEGEPVPTSGCEGGSENKSELDQAVRRKCRELSALVLRADDPREAAAEAMAYFPKHFEYVFELVHGQTRKDS